MVPDVAPKGHSFNGAFAYYLHDKRRDGEARRDTAERVAWTETRNLATDDPSVARKVMIATASQAEALKKAAGVRASGRKSTQHVYAYSLAWHPDEKGQIDRAEMVRAADASLQVLGADHLQAVIVCHQETRHPHVHIIVNRVDPSTGRMHTFSNDHRQLDAWALAYREARAEHLKYCPARAEKRDARRTELAQTFDRAAPPPRRGQAPANFNDAAAPVGQYQALQIKAADLAKRGAAMRERHSTEWRELSDGGKTKRAGAYDQAKADLARARATIAEEFRPHWRDLFKRQAAERRNLRRADLLSLAWAAWTVTRDERGGQKIDAGFLTSALQFIVSKEQRERRLAARHGKERDQLAALVRRSTDHEAKKGRATRGKALELERKRFSAARTALIEAQAREKMANRQAWREITAARALLDLRQRDPARRHFQTAGEIRANAPVVDRQPRRSRDRSTDRSRSRTRTRDDGPT